MTNTNTNVINAEVVEVMESIVDQMQGNKKEESNMKATVNKGKQEVTLKVSNAWAAMKACDYKGAFSKAITHILDFGTAINKWSKTTRIGRFTRGTLKYMSYATLAGFVVPTTASIVLNAALVLSFGGGLVALHNLYKYGRMEDANIPAIVFKSFGTMAAFLVGAWFIAPVLFAGTAYVAELIMFAIAHNFVVIFA